MKGVLFQNFLDPIAKVWGVSQPGHYSTYLREKEVKPDKKKMKVAGNSRKLDK